MTSKDYVLVNDLKNWDKNPRGIKKEDFSRLKQQIKQLGQYKPLLVNQDNIVLGGNMRLRAYKELGINKVWVSRIETSTEQEMIEYALSDNDRAGYYEDEALAELVIDMPDLSLDMFAVDLGKLTPLQDVINKFGPEPEEDEAPDLDEEGEPVSKLGEVYQLGRHRLMCGDATKTEDVEKLMDGKKADMVFTDPPYGIGISSNPVRQKHTKSDWDDSTPTKEFFDYLLTTARDIVIWGGNYFELPPSQGFFIWDKKQPENFSLAMCEMAWTNKQTPAKIYRESVTSYEKQHPTQKPIGLCAWVMKFFEKGSVLDLFGGSGSTLIACEQTNRTCYMMELDPKYCDVIRKRYAKFIDREDEWQTITVLPSE